MSQKGLARRIRLLLALAVALLVRVAPAAVDLCVTAREQPVAALGVGLAPQIVQPGPVLEEASLLAGDEILWIDHDEAKSASSAAALLAAAHGDVTIIARRKREEPLADWWTDFVTVASRA